MENKQKPQNQVFDELLTKARAIKEKHQIETFIYFEIIDLLQEAYTKALLEGSQMSRQAWKVGEYANK